MNDVWILVAVAVNFLRTTALQKNGTDRIDKIAYDY